MFITIYRFHVNSLWFVPVIRLNEQSNIILINFTFITSSLLILVADHAVHVWIQCLPFYEKLNSPRFCVTYQLVERIENSYFSIHLQCSDFDCYDCVKESGGELCAITTLSGSYFRKCFLCHPQHKLSLKLEVVL